MLWAMLATMLAIWAVIAVPFVLVVRRRRRRKALLAKGRPRSKPT